MTIPARHFVIALLFALLWGLANTLGWMLAHASTNLEQSSAHFVYESLLPMLLLVVGIAMADAHTGGNPHALWPYAIAAVTAAIVGELLFAVTAPLIGLGKCGCTMDSWPAGARTANMLPDSLLICGFMTAGYRYWRRASLRLARLNARDLERAQLTRHTLESRLQAMQACIEPQFLFDTLGTIERLHVPDPRTATRLIDELIVYLRAALPHLRESTSTVAKEGELVRAWMNIQHIRSGNGPSFEMHIGAGAGSASMPPMVLLPLVECAMPEADDPLRIDIHVDGDRLRIDAYTTATRDDGKLTALRERLHTLYGDEARLSMGYDRITLDLPYESTDRDHR